MAYDASTGQVVLFGGFTYTPQESLSDTWTSNGLSWTQRTPAHVPTPRDSAEMAYDQASGQLVMFGGETVGVGGLDDTWVWTGSDWMQLHPAQSPPNLNAAAITYDPATKQLVMFGGFEYTSGLNGEILNTTWTWNGTTWTQQHPTAAPPASAQGTMAFDPQLNEVVMLTNTAPAQTWAWNGSNWRQLSSSTNPPSRRLGAMALDTAANQLILTGGVSDANAPLADTWTEGTSWSQLTPSQAAPAVPGAAIATDPATGHLMLFGGFVGATGAALSNQTWAWGPLTIDPGPLPTATVGVAYRDNLAAVGLTNEPDWQIASGSLPAGLSLSNVGTISGTPSVSGTFTFTVSVTDGKSTATRSLTLTVGPGTIPGVYVANGANSQIHGFALSAAGNATPVTTLSGPLTTLNGPTGLLFDQLGRLYVANSGADTVDLFAAGASGNVAPKSVLGGAKTGLASPYGLALDSTGDLYVADQPANTITVYAPGASGNVTPMRTITGPHTQLDSPQAVQIDAAGHLWVANAAANTLSEYAASANGDSAPLATISGVDGPEGLTQNAAGQLVATNTDGAAVTAFANPGPTGEIVPALTIAGAAARLDFPIGVDVDAAGRLYVANQFGGLNVYGAGASGNATPLAVIAGGATGLAAPGAVAVTPPLVIVTQSLPRATTGRRYHQRLHSALGRRPLHWRVAHGRLPAGLRLSRTGELSGTPKHAGKQKLTIEVTDSTKPVARARRTMELAIAPAKHQPASHNPSRKRRKHRSDHSQH
ncbi:MAG TPA: putative Ig domain-containing protein [Solirubrobacteraceae bacterium]|nr:putative Ig domain-containing protein [Solirubrobacteraceae bacterium]